MSFKVLIGGYDGAGKSTLACSVFVYLQMLGHDVGLHELDPWSDTHAPLLGYKSWAERTKRTGFVDADIYSRYVEPFLADQRSIVLGDIQGNYQYEHNGLWANSADAAVLVSREPTEKDIWRELNQSRDLPGPQSIEGWQKLFANSGIKRNAIVYVHTLQNDQVEPAEADPNDYFITARALDRAIVPFNPGVVALANCLLSLKLQKSR